MTVLTVVQARMGSTRLPGKVLADLGGRPALDLMLSRLEGRLPGTLVVATSTSLLDDPVAELCARRATPVVRGSEADVLGRFVTAAKSYPADHVVRLTGDCPLSDPAIVRDILAAHIKSAADYTSNTLVRTFPDGLDVEVTTSEALFAAAREATDPIEREHVTPFIYRHPERFLLAAVRGPVFAGHERWTIDTAEDLEFVRRIVANASAATAPWLQILDTIGRRWRPESGVVHLRPCTEADADLLLAWRNDPVAISYATSRNAVDPAGHPGWLAARLANPATRIWIGEVDGQPVGQVRTDVCAAVGEVSVAVDPAHRGRGWGRRLLESLVSALRADYQVVVLRAVVNEANAASLRIFSMTGFRPVARSRPFVTLERPV